MIDEKKLDALIAFALRGDYSDSEIAEHEFFKYMRGEIEIAPEDEEALARLEDVVFERILYGTTGGRNIEP